MLGIPAVVPTVVAAYAIVGERQQGTLEPVLTTPVRRDEFLLGKALAALAPSVVVAYAVFALVVAIIGLFADPRSATALLRGSAILAQIVFTPPGGGMVDLDRRRISARARDIRVAHRSRYP